MPSIQRAFSVFLIGQILFLQFSSCVFAHHPGYSPVAAREGKKTEISSSSMVNSPTASMLGKNRFSAGFTFDYVKFDSPITPAEAHSLHHQDRHVHGKKHEEFYNMDAAFGVTEDMDVYLSAPVVSKSVIETDEHHRVGTTETANGFGDMRLIGKYRFWKKVIESAVIAGIKFPTGKTTAEKSFGSEFETEEQPGSGSWDGEFGLVISRGFKRHFSTAMSFQYFLKTRGAQEYHAGDVFRYNVGGSYALRELGRYPNLIVSVELNNEWALRDSVRGHGKVLDSGGTTVYITPGFSASVTKNLSAFVGMPLPIHQNLGGVHEEVDLELLSGVNFYF